MRSSHTLRVLAMAAVIVMSATSITVASAMLLRCATACTGTVDGRAAPPPPAPAAVTIAPGNDSRDVDPLAPVSVSAANGKLTAVKMVNDAGKPIEGVMTPDDTSWKPLVPLGYGRTYTHHRHQSRHRRGDVHTGLAVHHADPR